MAASDAITARNVAKALVMPRCQGEVDKRVIGIEDIRRAQLVLPIRERLLFRLAVCEGMRPGEITALKVGDLGGDGMFHIERRVYRGRVDTPKSRRSKRPIPPTETTRALFDTYVSTIDAKPEDWLFSSERGTPLSYTNVYRRRIQPALTQVDLGKINFQVLRRTWVTQCAEAEKDPKVRAQLAGHSVDVSENEYRQPDADVLRRAMRKLDERLQ
jgi:integrase